jgi:hypothetical protein
LHRVTWAGRHADPAGRVDRRPGTVDGRATLDQAVGRRGAAGQVAVLFVAAMVAIVGMAALLIDGGRAFTNQRQAQAAADTAALAAGYAASAGQNAVAAARGVASANGFPTDLANCAGATVPGGGVVVNQPPASGPHAGQDGYIEVLTTRAMRTTFAGVLGSNCWLVSARAVASIESSAAAPCGLCVLGTDGTPETLGLSSDARLRVDGAVYVNQNHWTSGSPATLRCGTNPCRADACNPSPWSRPGGNSSDENMCGESLSLSNANGGTDLLSASTIAVRGGWYSKRQNLVKADSLAPGCQYHPTPSDWVADWGVSNSNVCIGMPVLVDPLNDPGDPGNQLTPPNPNDLQVPVAGQNGCVPARVDAPVRVPTGTLGSPQRLAIQGADAGGPYWTICPGIYYGGFSVTGDNRNVKVWMQPGIYYMVGGGASGGGGFVVAGTASIDGSAGVMIYLTGGQESFQENTSPGTNLVQSCPPVPSGSLCIAPVISGNGNGISSSPANITVNQSVTYTLNITGNPTTTPPTGTVSFYDGQSAICSNVPLVAGSSPKWRATCTTSFPLVGTRGITAVYSGDTRYAMASSVMTETINPPAGVSAGTFNICTGPPCGADGAQSMGEPINTVVLHAMETGPYAGILAWQDRQSGLGLKIWPYKGAADCSGNWFTAGVPPDTTPIPQPCGPLGGLKGTIYAPHLKNGSTDHDASINFRGSGLAYLQVITGTASFAYPGDIRFYYEPSTFANGKTHLVE